MNDKKSIAFILASKGYDVWLGNHRGTKYARNHVKLDPDTDQEYWKFSFVEMGEQDMPASINYVRNLTGVGKVSYIGHSQGTTQMFHGLAINQEYWKRRVNVFIACAPVIIPNQK